MLGAWWVGADYFVEVLFAWYDLLRYLALTSSCRLSRLVIRFRYIVRYLYDCSADGHKSSNSTREGGACCLLLRLVLRHFLPVLYIVLHERYGTFRLLVSLGVWFR